MAVRWAAPARGQVGIFADPEDSARILVKRVVAVAGDRLQWDERGVVLNGVPLTQRPLPDDDPWHIEVPIEIDGAQSYAAVTESLGQRGRDAPHHVTRLFAARSLDRNIRVA